MIRLNRHDSRVARPYRDGRQQGVQGIGGSWQRERLKAIEGVKIADCSLSAVRDRGERDRGEKVVTTGEEREGASTTARTRGFHLAEKVLDSRSIECI